MSRGHRTGKNGPGRIPLSLRNRKKELASIYTLRHDLLLAERRDRAPYHTNTTRVGAWAMDLLPPHARTMHAARAAGCCSRENTRSNSAAAQIGQISPRLPTYGACAAESTGGKEKLPAPIGLSVRLGSAARTISTGLVLG